MKRWYSLTCAVCGFRHSLGRFIRATQPILHPAQLVTGGGRGSGFHVVRYIPWSNILGLKTDPGAWRALNCEYIRLASAYDNFYDHLGFLSPRMLDVTNALTAETFRLRVRCRELTDLLERSRLYYAGYDAFGSFGRFLEEANKRAKHDRTSVRAILEST